MTSLLSDPFLQLPTENSVRVVWFTEFAGIQHYVVYGENLEHLATATTTQLTRVREDNQSKVTPVYDTVTQRKIWRHEAEVSEIIAGKRLPYRVVSKNDLEVIESKIFTLSALPIPETPLKILLTSDHQLMPMTAANLQKVCETIGIDAVFFAGDLVNISDRASEWFDDNRGGAFFPCLQGHAHYELQSTIYQGGEIIQHVPLYPAIGNHEVMGRFSTTKGLNEQFYDAVPRFNGLDKDNSFNTDTYEEIFTLPGNKRYYAVTFGDIRLVVLYVTNVWRSPSLDSNIKGRYQEAEQDLDYPESWGYGQHIFESISRESQQYQWLEKELNSIEFRKAKYKIVMFHHPPHTLGANIVPPYTAPIQNIERDENNKILAIRYDYPKEKDYIIQDLIPLLEASGVHLVFYGHSHLWNRFRSSKGTHFLESSNVGNSYGAYVGDLKRPIPNNSVYAATGDPNGLDPIIPTIAPIKDENNQPLPYIASNEITAFSIFDTEKGRVSSYYFDTRYPHSNIIQFDQFSLLS
ncbi:metallophosphoesterase [Aphanothece hegewaldii CCALA 016]|uniref:Metallophosphoesterase n=1 Tax=Aphanothece hegewaldii CCALA 016 TaxID=2107694 RepID=A0A2T1LZ61_9CHRO|nr:metallophosphoesterase [Aphanothece hegewaldii]PSF37695.1 metallophosphoesterase [Aphanothece hegewaldii CCALA 016]